MSLLGQPRPNRLKQTAGGDHGRFASHSDPLKGGAATRWHEGTVTTHRMERTEGPLERALSEIAIIGHEGHGSATDRHKQSARRW